jgi:osmotically-inducible protein OsmY
MSVPLDGLARSALGFAAILLALACGESRQEKFEKAMHAAEVARTALDSAREGFASHEVVAEEARAAAAEAEAELGVARQKLDAASATYESARAEVARWADDASVTRVLQQQLLDEPALAVAAVSARVENGTALLEGSAPDDETRERAAAIAREIPGVVDVQSQIAVVAVAPAPVEATTGTATDAPSAAMTEPPAENEIDTAEPYEPAPAPAP